ncbi:MAG: alginate lyase family protein [Paraprevotella sp.]|nr:alginate lyase family protein [Paraprevotella sp.]
MKKKVFTMMVLLIMLIAGVAGQQRVFNHPGSILSQTDLDRIKQHVEAGDEPWASCWKAMQNDDAAKSSYTANPSTEIGGSNGTRQRAAADAYAAMLNAIEWHVTGKAAYANCAARILTAWGNKLETVSAELFQYPCRSMIVAAELLRTQDGFYEGWAESDRNTFLSKVRTLMVPACRQFCTYQGSHPSWYTPAALVVQAAGVLLDDEALYQEGYNLQMTTDHWGTMFGGSIEPSGQMREMGRDNVHAGLTLCDIAQACLISYNQGDDMFAEGDNRLLRGMEYWCKYNTGHTDVPYEPLDCSGLDHATGFSFYYISTHNNGFRLRPDACSFEAVYHHYKEVKGMDATTEFPYLEIATRLARPDTKDHGTLFYTINADASPVMTEAPQRPVAVKAEDGYRCVYLSWQHPEREDVRGFRIYRSVNGTSFSLLTTWDYYTNNAYKDENVEAGKTYYYKVQFINKAGYSEQSDIVCATVQDGSDELPLGWNYCGVNSSAYGSGAYCDVQDSTFIVNGLGSDIGGTVDTHGFVYKKITGDATLTVRLVSTDESFYKVGVLMRATLNGNSQRVGLTLGETGCRMLRQCVRFSAGANTTWVNGTNYGRAPFWLRIKREGNRFTTFISRDNMTWHQIGQTDITSMPKTYYVGMAVCNRQTKDVTYQAVFDHVTLTGIPAQPAAVPKAPTNFKAAWTDTNEATLSWNPVADVDSFLVYRDNVCVATTRATRYVDTNMAAGTYTYKVSGRNAKGEGRPSADRTVSVDAVVKISGNVIGTAGSYQNNPSTTRSAALDGNIGTYFDAAETSGAWVGYDMGSRYQAQVLYVKYAPRTGYPARMVGGKFQVAKEPDFSDAVTLATISEVPAEGTLSKLPASSSDGYRYLRYLGPDGGNCNVAEIQFFGRKTRLEDTGVDDVYCTGKGEMQGNVYNISGQLVRKMGKGIYIINGRKVLMK